MEILFYRIPASGEKQQLWLNASIREILARYLVFASEYSAKK